MTISKRSNSTARDVTYSSLDLLDLFHPQTWPTHLAIPFSCFIMLMIQGCPNISFGVGRVKESTMSLRRSINKVNIITVRKALRFDTYVCLIKSLNS